MPRPRRKIIRNDNFLSPAIRVHYVFYSIELGQGQQLSMHRSVINRSKVLYVQLASTSTHRCRHAPYAYTYALRARGRERAATCNCKPIYQHIIHQQYSRLSLFFPSLLSLPLFPPPLSFPLFVELKKFAPSTPIIENLPDPPHHFKGLPALPASPPRRASLKPRRRGGVTRPGGSGSGRNASGQESGPPGPVGAPSGAPTRGRRRGEGGRLSPPRRDARTGRARGACHMSGGPNCI